MSTTRPFPKVFVFFVEPGSYTLDLIAHVHRPLGIGHAFFKGAPKIAKSATKSDAAVLSRMGAWQRVRFLLRTFKENDLIVFNGYNTPDFFLFFLAAWLKGGKKVLAIESDTQFKPPRGWKGILKSLYLKTLFARPFVLGFAGGRHSHMELFRFYGMNRNNLFLLPMVVDNDKFRSDSPRPDEPYVFLFVGRLIPLKRVDLLIEAFLRNFKDAPGVRLEIVGDGESANALRERYGRMAGVAFRGALYGDELIEAYRNAHVLVLPSEREQWGLVVNEAMASGMPVIVSDRVGARFDLVDGRDTGLVFREGDVNDLGEKMRKIYEEKGLYRKMARNARELMQKEWNYELYAENLRRAVRRAGEIAGGGR